MYVISNPKEVDVVDVVDDGVMVEVGNTVVLVVVVLIKLVDEALLGGGFCEGLAEVDNVKLDMDTEAIDINEVVTPVDWPLAWGDVVDVGVLVEVGGTVVLLGVVVDW